jgi:fibronectin-binding autotransporter adhesin
MYKNLVWVMVFALIGLRVVADNGTYTNGNGAWSTAGNWQVGTIADGADYTATFRGPGNASYTVTNDGPRTIGNITVNHYNDGYSFTITTNGLNDAITLETTLGSPVPIPKLSRTSGSLTIRPPLLGNQGVEVVTSLAKPITLASPDSTYSGDTLVSSGYLRIGASSDGPTVTKGPLGTGRLQLKDGSQLSSDSGTARTLYNNIEMEGAVGHGHSSENGMLDLYGTITLNADVLLNAVGSGTTVFNGPIVNGSEPRRLTHIGGRNIKLSSAASTYGGGTVINVNVGQSTGIRIGVDTVGDPPVSGPFGTGSVSYVAGTIAAVGGTGRVFSNPFTLDGNVSLSVSTTDYGPLTFTRPWILTGNRIVSSAQNSSHYVLFEGGLTDNGNNWRLDTRSSGSSSIRMGGAVNIGGGVRVWDVNLNAMPTSIWNTVVTLADNLAVYRFHNSSVATSTVAAVVFSNCSAYVWAQGISSTPGTGRWVIPSLTRMGRATLTVGGYRTGSIYYGPALGSLAATDKILVADSPALVNGMVAPYYLEQGGEFMTYEPLTNGFKRVSYSTATDINADGLETAIFNAASAQTLTGNREVYALKSGANIGGAYDLTLGSGGITLNSGTPAIACNVQFNGVEGLVFNNVTASLDGVVKGSNGFTKWGSGLLTLSSANTFSGVTTINDGTLKLAASGALPASRPLTVNAGTLDLQGFGLNPGVLTMCAGLITNTAGSATITLSDDLVYAGSYRQATIAGNGMALALGGAQTIRVDDGYSTDDLLIASLITGSNGFVKRGGGRLRLESATNSFSGGITIYDGAVAAVSTAAGQTPIGIGNSVAMKESGQLGFLRGSGSINTAGVIMDAIIFSGNASIFATLADNYFRGQCVSLDRASGSRGTLVFQGVRSGSYDHFNSRAELFVTNAPCGGAVNGILPPYVVLAGEVQTDIGLARHATTNTSRRIIGYSYTVATVTGATATATTPVDLAVAQTMSASKEIYALRQSAGLGVSGGGIELTLGSGGLIVNANLTNAPNLKFGSSGTAEGCLYVAANYSGTLAGKLTTSGGLTKFGGGILVLAADSSDLLGGGIAVNAGTLRVANASALPSASEVYIVRGATFDVDGNYTLGHAFKGLGRIATGTNVLTVTGSMTPGSPDADESVGTLMAGNLKFEGTYNWQYDGTNSDVVATSALAFDGAPTLNASWLGEGAAPAGTYTLFTYAGSAPANVAWTVNAPQGRMGTVSVDDANKRVVLMLDTPPTGTLMILR